jgi:2-keto-3-deoxy-6-phosphogluconate aldolase
MNFIPPVVEAALKENLPIFCGIQSPKDCEGVINFLLSQKNVADRTVVLKIFPVKDIAFVQIMKIMSLITQFKPVLVSKGVSLDVVAAGGICLQTSREEIQKYQELGISNIAVGYDFAQQKKEPESILNFLSLLDSKLSRR